MLTFLTGGARSGKSTLAVDLASGTGSVAFIATAPRIEGDDDLAARIERHRSERPADWTTIEEPIHLAAAIRGAPADSTLIVDCLTVWLGNLIHRELSAEAAIAACDEALGAVRARTSDSIVISNEVGSGIVPADAPTRLYRDLLGAMNQRWAAAADRAWMVVAGHIVPLRPIDHAVDPAAGST